MQRLEVSCAVRHIYTSLREKVVTYAYEFPPEEQLSLKKLVSELTSQIVGFPIFASVVSDYSKLVETNIKPYHSIHALNLSRNRELTLTGRARFTGAAATCNRFLVSGPVSYKITARKEKLMVIVSVSSYKMGWCV